ncbi:uroporphyrinogen decarboxylase [Ferrithrix thermotolerans DSM 19514]|uniref:Uroporphyrinogen decarboxylase n=1 Tax=Ferrithrix thermotolerans DSM 19514 TaxID=1121881 RepID=A0A1M4VCF2_9ACTN|nr:uroporphyrinogen decarboxylase [Ferrithrix thermotolerans]SHE66597.1 uroporphyrinogen decarboxylase [Ferrithrix thermotolerans DSM 19514]
MTEHPLTTHTQKPLIDPSILRAAKRERPERTPVWFMRQAGRSLPEYREIRGIGSILDVIKDAKLVAEITMQPVRRYGVDAAVLYSDIMVPLLGAGVSVDIVQGKGPQISNPMRTTKDLDLLRPTEIRDAVHYVKDAIEILKSSLEVPLIGFAGAPFTVASYLIEGGPSKSYSKTKALMLEDERMWHGLMERLVEVAFEFLRLQIDAGVDLIQVFDSWVGSLSQRHYLKYVKPYTRELFNALSTYPVPKIHFGVGTGELLADMADMNIDVLGVDWRTSLRDAKQRSRRPLAMQGNLDPAVLEASPKTVLSECIEVIKSSRSCDGYIFNLGHGVPPHIDPAQLERIVRFVHEFGDKIRYEDLDPSVETIWEYLD